MTTVSLSPQPISNRSCKGLGVQADCYIYDDVNRQFGVEEADYARWERRLKALRPGIARIFLPINEFNPSGDGKTYDWNTAEMQRQYRNLSVLKDSGAQVNLCMGPWTNKEMTAKGSERFAVDLAGHLINEKRFDNIRWLSLFNEPDAIYAPDTALNADLKARGFGGGLPFEDYVEKHRDALSLLKDRGLDSQVCLVVGDMAWPPARRLEWIRLLVREFGTAVSYSFHHYAPDEDDFDSYFCHPGSEAFRPPSMADEVGAYRQAVGAAPELICWEFNQLGWGSCNFSHFPGVGLRGEDHIGSFRAAVGHARKVMSMLANGVDGMCHWCVGDMFYRSGIRNGVMRFGLWRYKWEGWVPRPVYFYLAALIEAFRPGNSLHPLTGLPARTLGLAAKDRDASLTIALLNYGTEDVSVSVRASGPMCRLRISPNHLPRRPDILDREKPADEMPLTDWQVVAADTAAQPLWIAPQELTLLRCQA
jgi:hypothetical protein